MSAPTTTTTTTTKYDYDFAVIGGGSGGLAASKSAAALGKKVVLIEYNRLGGTCVNVGCVPKKIMFNAASVVEGVEYAEDFGFKKMHPKLNFATLKAKRDAVVKRLNGVYEHGVDELGVDLLLGWAKFQDEHTLTLWLKGKQVRTITAETILIATGGEPTVPDVPGKELAITSEGFFDLDVLPKKVAVIGSGYIAIELSGILNALGSDAHLVMRSDRLLRAFDEPTTDRLQTEALRRGLNIHKDYPVTKLERHHTHGTITLFGPEGSTPMKGFHSVVYAVGRHSLVTGLNIEAVKGLELDRRNRIKVDEKQYTGVANIYALGDVTGPIELTPVAIKCGRLLVERIYVDPTTKPMDYTGIPSVIFSHPPMASVGLTEAAAVAKYGADKVEMHTSGFINLYEAMREQDRKERSYVRLVVVGDEKKVVGVHCVGRGVDEMMQGVAIAVKCGATLDDFASTVAIHPTASEELVLTTPEK